MHPPPSAVFVPQRRGAATPSEAPTGLDGRIASFRIRAVHGPDVLASVAQILASLNVTIVEFAMVRSPGDACGADLRFEAAIDERTADLVCRKLERLIDVLHVEAPAFAERLDGSAVDGRSDGRIMDPAFESLLDPRD